MADERMLESIYVQILSDLETYKESMADRTIIKESIRSAFPHPAKKLARNLREAANEIESALSR